MNIILVILGSVLVALFATSKVHPRLVMVAKMKQIVDNPDARKLQKDPVPVLGGLGVYFGLFMSLGFMCLFFDCSELFVIYLAMGVMLFTGVMDDILNLSPRVKFTMQILAILLLMIGGGYMLDNFHGLFGISGISPWIAMPLTLFACLGVINAVNLMDGVDGLASGFGIVVALLCGTIFVAWNDIPFVVLAFGLFGALIPFFLHNVFGRKYKMFIGDGGSLTLGLIACVFIMRILQHQEVWGEQKGMVGFVLALFSIPVFDTLRVMTTRMLKGSSPFSPDKTHLHHILLRLGLRHVAVAMWIISFDLFIVLAWYLLGKVSFVSQEFQLFAVIFMAVSFTLGIWYGLSRFEKKRPRQYKIWQERIKVKRIKREGFLLKIQQLLDRL